MITAADIRDDRVQRDLKLAAAVSDRGLVHDENEDSFFVELHGEEAMAVVVCDGVSSACAGGLGARSAARAAGAVLSAAMSDPLQDASAVIATAIETARGAVGQLGSAVCADRADPACTLVCALCRRGEIAIGWVGDSRAYWLDREDTLQLTVDDSWAAESVACGLLTAEQAARSPFAHAITDWLGAGAAERPPHLVVVRPARAGRLVLCTDGLWNYAASTAELRKLVDALGETASPAEVARSLTDTALARGGHDNVTVAVVDLNPGPAPGSPARRRRTTNRGGAMQAGAPVTRGSRAAHASRRRSCVHRGRGPRR
ncbi:MAG: PP2C family protein-serine/threonine phosphatase [Solirubrobacteraceae bacterium]